MAIVRCRRTGTPSRPPWVMQVFLSHKLRHNTRGITPPRGPRQLRGGGRLGGGERRPRTGPPRTRPPRTQTRTLQARLSRHQELKSSRQFLLESVFSLPFFTLWTRTRLRHLSCRSSCPQLARTPRAPCFLRGLAGVASSPPGARGLTYGRPQVPPKVTFLQITTRAAICADTVVTY